MKFLARLCVVLLAVNLAALTVSFHTLQTLSNPDKIDQALQKSGSYDFIAQQVGKQFGDALSADLSGPVKTASSTAVSRAITPQLTSQTLKPVLVGLTDYMKNGSSETPQLSIDTSVLKTAVITAAQAGTDKTQQAQIKFELTRVLPDKLDLAQVNQTTGPNKSFNGLRSGYANFNKSILYQLGLCLLLLILIIAMSLSNKRRILRRPAWAALFASAIVAFLAYPLLLILRQTLLSPKTFSVDNQSVLEIVRGLSNYLLQGLTPYAIGLAVAAAVLGGLSFLLPKPKDAKKR